MRNRVVSGFDWVLLGFTGFDLVRLSFIDLDTALMGFSSMQRIFQRLISRECFLFVSSDFLSTFEPPTIRSSRIDAVTRNILFFFFLFFFGIIIKSDCSPLGRRRGGSP